MFNSAVVFSSVNECSALSIQLKALPLLIQLYWKRFFLYPGKTYLLAECQGIELLYPKVNNIFRLSTTVRFNWNQCWCYLESTLMCWGLQMKTYEPWKVDYHYRSSSFMQNTERQEWISSCWAIAELVNLHTSLQFTIPHCWRLNCEAKVGYSGFIRNWSLLG